jgi:hypothetical protein
MIISISKMVMNLKFIDRFLLIWPPNRCGPFLYLLGFIFAFSGGAYFSTASAWKDGSAAKGIVCPRSIDNGCSDSPGGSVIIANFFTGYTGTTYSKRPQANMACIDYYCGMPAVSVPALGICGIDRIQDPATAIVSTTSGDPGCGVIPKGCHFYQNGVRGQTTGPTLFCLPGAAGDTVYKGFDLGAIGSHGGTIIWWHNNNTGHLTVKYNRGLADLQNYRNGTFVGTVNGTTSDITIYANTFDGRWLSQFDTVGIFHATSSGTTLTVNSMTSGKILAHHYIFARGVANSTVLGQLTGKTGKDCATDPANCDGAIGTYQTTRSVNVANEVMESVFQLAAVTLNTSGNIDVEYNYFNEINSRPTGGQTIHAPGGMGGTVLFAYNMFNGFLFTPYNAEIPNLVHGEVFEGTSGAQTVSNTYPSIIYRGNICYLPQSALGADTTCFYISTGSNSQAVGTSTTVTNTLLIDNVAVSKNGKLMSATLAAWGYLIYTNTKLIRNFVDADGAPYRALCTNAPFIGGVYNSDTSGFTNAPLLSGNIDLPTGRNIDASLITYSNCRRP